MATIKKKRFLSDTSKVAAAHIFFDTAAELLGDEWSGMADQGYELYKKTPSGNYGWRVGSAEDHLVMISENLYYNTLSTPGASIPIDDTQTYRTCVVWEGDNGSVGIGEEIDAEIHITLLMPKFTGTFNGHDVYGLCNRSSGSSDPGTSDIYGYGCKSIGRVNDSNTIAGSGVYLHPLLDPHTGLTCSDVFGVQCFDGESYRNVGMTIKQGGNTYVSALGETREYMYNILFIKL